VVSPTVGSISGSVINQATGLGIPGVTIQLLSQLNNTFVGATTTDANGAYTFTNEPPGSYLVVQSVPNGFAPVSPTTLTVTVVAGANQGNINFLDSSVGPPAGTTTISGFALRDVALNGNPNGDQGLAGMVVVLSGASGQIASAVTDVTGIFSFSGLAGGTYTLTATPPNGLTSTNAIPGQGGIKLSASSIRVTTTPGTTSYAGQLFLAGP